MSNTFIDTSRPTKGRLEKYLKKLAGRTDMEDSLKKLDKLTQEEARMATAQVLKVTHTIDEGVRGIADKVVTVDGKVTGIDEKMVIINDRMASVDDKVDNVDTKVEAVDLRVVGVDERVAGVDERVRTVDDKVALVIEGVQIIFSQLAHAVIYSVSSRWKGGSDRHKTSSQRRRSD